MVKILISGALGRMGKKVFEACQNNEQTKAVCGVDLIEDFSNSDFPIYSSFSAVKENPDVIIDFSSPLNLNNILDFATENGIPAVLCATGYDDENLNSIKIASKKTAIFRSANMSLGVNVLIDLVKRAAKTLYGFDVEIVEKHHNKKVDAPSGTALMLADGIKEIQKDKYYTYGRNGKVGARDVREIGIHAIRGGNIVGEHDVIFAGENEILTFSHQATDRGVFANGAVNAAIFLANKKIGVYDMNDLLREQND